MKEYRVKSQSGAETSLTLDTLREQAAKGELRPSDEVAVEDGPFQPASSLSDLDEHFAAALATSFKGDVPATDPWQHFDENEPSASRPPQGLLGAFLDHLDSPGSSPEDGPDPPSSPAPGTPAAEDTSGAASEQNKTSSLQGSSVPRWPQPRPPRAPGGSVEEGPTEARSIASSAPSSGALRWVGAEPAEPAAPASFKEWMGSSNDAEGNRLLAHLGGHGHELIPPTVSPFRSRRTWGYIVFGLVILLLLSGWGYVRFVASIDYPTREELAQRRSEAVVPPQAVGSRRGPEARGRQNGSVARRGRTGSADGSGPGLAQSPLAAKSRKMRGKVGDKVNAFDSAEALENEIFRDLINQGLKPTKVTVVTLRSSGPKGAWGRKPAIANVEVELIGVDDEDRGRVSARIMDRVMLCMMVLGKYASLRGLTLSLATVRFGEPSSYEKTLEGRLLANYFNGSADPAVLFLGR